MFSKIWGEFAGALQKTTSGKRKTNNQRKMREIRSPQSAVASSSRLAILLATDKGANGISHKTERLRAVYVKAGLRGRREARGGSSERPVGSSAAGGIEAKGATTQRNRAQDPLSIFCRLSECEQDAFAIVAMAPGTHPPIKKYNYER